METPNWPKLIDEIEGLEMLEMNGDAMDKVDELGALIAQVLLRPEPMPEDFDVIEFEERDRAMDRARVVSLKIARKSRRWDSRFADSVEANEILVLRAEAGLFYLEHAVYLCTAGDHQAARESIRKLAEVWPEGRKTAIEDERLAPLRPDWTSQ